MTETILYIDDQPQLAEQIDGMLAQAGYELVHVTNSEEALRVARERRLSLVLAEVLIPDRNGFELIKEIMSLETSRLLPVVVVTRGERTPDLYGRALELGVEDFLCKPVTRPQLLEAVLEYAQTDESDTAAQSSEPAAVDSFEGNLPGELLPGLLGRLHRAGASGVLTLRRGSEARSLELRNGSPVQVSRHRNVESVAEYLLKTRRIDGQQYEMLVDQLMARLAGPREILLGMEALTEKQLETATHEQARSVLDGMLCWISGEYAFVAGARLEVADCLELDCDVSETVVSAAKSLDAEAIRGVLDRVGGRYVFLSTTDSDRLEHLDLSTRQRSELLGLTGERTVAEVLAKGALDGPTLYQLYSSGRVELEAAPVLVLEEALKPVEHEDAELEVDPEDHLMAPDVSRRNLPKQRVVDDGTTESTIRLIAENLDEQDDFDLFGIDENSSDFEVRAAYDQLLAQLRPEKIPRELDELHALAKDVGQRLERAYGRVRGADTRRAFAGLRKLKPKAKPETVEPVEAEKSTEGSRAVEAESWFRTGEGHLSHKEFDQAVEAFGMAVHCDPNQGDYAAHLGYALYKSNPDNPIIRREALEHVAKGVKLAPDREKPLLFLGRIFRETGDSVNAAKVLRRALKISPDSPPLVQEMCLIDGTSKQSKRGLLDRLRRR